MAIRNRSDQPSMASLIDFGGFGFIPRGEYGLKLPGNPGHASTRRNPLYVPKDRSVSDQKTSATEKPERDGIQITTLKTRENGERRIGNDYSIGCVMDVKR